SWWLAGNFNWATSLIEPQQDFFDLLLVLVALLFALNQMRPAPLVRFCNQLGKGAKFWARRLLNFLLDLFLQDFLPRLLSQAEQLLGNVTTFRASRCCR